MCVCVTDEREKLEQEASRQLDEEKAKSLNLSKELEELKAEGRNGPERCGEGKLQLHTGVVR